ncbi:MAG: hypothetical protein GY898_25020 [Proteobacteria bacterium]|nr:hypothetical protein [Pseudomonadota bacterium]
MNSIRTVMTFALIGVLLAGGVVLTGWRPANVTTEEVAPSVRGNPGSYKPLYASHTGYQRYQRASGGGGGGGVVYIGGGSRSSGGGHGYGK